MYAVVSLDGVRLPGRFLRKKKKKSHSSSEHAEHAKSIEKRVTRDGSDEMIETRSDLPTNGEEGRSGDGKRKLTEAERRFEETQRRRVSSLLTYPNPHMEGGLLGELMQTIKLQREERVAKMAKTTHKDRVHEFNAKLDQLRYAQKILPDKDYFD